VCLDIIIEILIRGKKEIFEKEDVKEYVTTEAEIIIIQIGAEEYCQPLNKEWILPWNLQNTVFR
jgi:hypothetical protein